MSKNFFGQTGDFFLKNSEFTKIQSDLIQDGLKFKSGEVYAARLKIRRSHNGKRFYTSESGSDGTNDNFRSLGATAYTGSTTSIVALTGGYYRSSRPRPQRRLSRNFTIYSRPTAFGPAVSGRTDEDHEDSFLSGTLDSLEGYNWAYTPPITMVNLGSILYSDQIHQRLYTLEDILSDTEAIYRRVDLGNNQPLPATIRTTTDY